jgi:hypothetical protein
MPPKKAKKDSRSCGVGLGGNPREKKTIQDTKWNPGMSVSRVQIKFPATERALAFFEEEKNRYR